MNENGALAEKLEDLKRKLGELMEKKTKIDSEHNNVFFSESLRNDFMGDIELLDRKILGYESAYQKCLAEGDKEFAEEIRIRIDSLSKQRDNLSKALEMIPELHEVGENATLDSDISLVEKLIVTLKEVIEEEKLDFNGYDEPEKFNSKDIGEIVKNVPAYDQQQAIEKMIRSQEQLMENNKGYYK